ncbi:hypothetical protein NUSPORA_00577 [Nucleospora cyclopteri]
MHSKYRSFKENDQNNVNCKNSSKNGKDDALETRLSHLRCIQCFNIVAPENASRTLCINCNQIYDKYKEVNDVYRMIDIILLQKRCFFHFINNRKEMNTNGENMRIVLINGLFLLINTFFLHEISFKALYLEFISIRLKTDSFCRLMKIHFLNIFLLYFFIQLKEILTMKKQQNAASKRNIKNILISALTTFYNVFTIYLFSNLYNSLLIIFYIWEYDKLYYYFIVNFLNCCSMVVAYDCYVNCKIFAYLLVLLVNVIDCSILIKREIIEITSLN